MSVVDIRLLRERLYASKMVGSPLVGVEVAALEELLETYDAVDVEVTEYVRHGDDRTLKILVGGDS